MGVTIVLDVILWKPIFCEINAILAPFNAVLTPFNAVLTPVNAVYLRTKDKQARTSLQKK